MNTKYNNDVKKIVALCNEYADNDFDSIFIYYSYEKKVEFCDFFFKLKNKIMEKNEIDTMLHIDLQTSIEKQKKYIKKILKEFQILYSKIQSNKEKIPMEIRIIYDVKKNEYQINMEYEPVYSNKDMFVSDVFEQWIKSEK